MNNELIFISAQIEEKAREGAEIILKFENLLTKEFSNLKEATVNGKYYNFNLDILNEELFKINITLESYLKKDNIINVIQLNRFVILSRTHRISALEAIKLIFEDKTCDEEDKEKCHKSVSIYDQLVTNYENLLMKLSLKNIALRTALNNGELKLEKIDIKKKYSSIEIEKIMNEFLDILKK